MFERWGTKFFEISFNNEKNLNEIDIQYFIVRKKHPSCSVWLNFKQALIRLNQVKYGGLNGLVKFDDCSSLYFQNLFFTNSIPKLFSTFQHSLTIVHTKRLLGRALLHVYVDGLEIHTAQLTFPTLNKVMQKNSQTKM